MMSSEQESYTPNICHQMQGTTIYVVPLLHPVISPNWPTETAAVSWGLQISWNNTPFLCQRLCRLVHEAQVVFFRRNDMHVSPDKATSKHSRARNELLSTLLSPQNCILTITTVFTNDKTPNLNSYFRGSSYWCYWEFLLKRVPCLPRVPIFPTPRLFHSCGCCAALTYRSFSIRHIPQNYLSLLVTNQSMGRSAPVRRGCWGKNGKCDQNGGSSSSVAAVNECQGGPESLSEQEESNELEDKSSSTNLSPKQSLLTLKMLSIS